MLKHAIESSFSVSQCHDKQIPKLSLIFEFDEEVAEIIDTVKNESKLYLFNFIDTTLQTP